MDSTFEEKSAWVTLLSLIGLFAFYAYGAAHLLMAGVTDVVAPFIALFGAVVALLVITLVAGHILAAIIRRPEARDERDIVIERRAEANSSWILGVGVVVAAFVLALPVGRAWVANGLLMALFFSEIVNYGLRLYYYRRGL